MPYHLAIPQYTNRFIHPTYCSRYGLRGLYFLQEAYMEASSSCTISLISDVTLPTRLGLRPIALRLPLVTSATLHLLSALLSHFQPNTDTGHLVLFEDCGSILLAVGWLDYIVITHMCPNLLIIFAREPQWAIWWSNQDLHLTHTMLTPYNRHYRSSHANCILLVITLVTMLAYSTLSFI